MIPVIYDLFFLCFALLYIPYLFVKGKWHKGFLMRLGFLPQGLAASLAGKETIWVHAVSVGEVVAVSRLVQKLKDRYPDKKIVVSTVTTTGQKIAREKIAEADFFLYAPLDFSLVVRRYLAALHPEIYIAAETELWPNLFHGLIRRGIPIAVVNGRLSTRSFYRYKKVKFLLQPLLAKIAAFCMQTNDDAERVLDLGARPETIHVLGNVKFDEAGPARFYTVKDLGLSEDNIVWVAGSTHPGEEEIVLAVYGRLRQSFPQLRLVVAPRHSERAGEIVILAEKAGLAAVRFSVLTDKGHDPDSVIVLDIMGALSGIYNAADFVFVGKSLVGQGGQNIIEPAALAKPVLTGPHMQNFQAVYDVFRQEKAVLEVKDAGDLEQKVRSLILDAVLRQTLGENARRVVQKYQGTTDKTVAVLSSLLAK